MFRRRRLVRPRVPRPDGHPPSWRVLRRPGASSTARSPKRSPRPPLRARPTLNTGRRGGPLTKPVLDGSDVRRRRIRSARCACAGPCCSVLSFLGAAGRLGLHVGWMPGAAPLAPAVALEAGTFVTGWRPSPFALRAKALRQPEPAPALVRAFFPTSSTARPRGCDAAIGSAHAGLFLFARWLWQLNDFDATPPRAHGSGATPASVYVLHLVRGRGRRWSRPRPL